MLSLPSALVGAGSLFKGCHREEAHSSLADAPGSDCQNYSSYLLVLLMRTHINLDRRLPILLVVYSRGPTLLFENKVRSPPIGRLRSDASAMSFRLQPRNSAHRWCEHLFRPHRRFLTEKRLIRPNGGTSRHSHLSASCSLFSSV